MRHFQLPLLIAVFVSCTWVVGCDPEGANVRGATVETVEKVPQAAVPELEATTNPDADPKARVTGFAAPDDTEVANGDKAGCQSQCGNDPICRVMCVTEHQGARVPGTGNSSEEDCDQCGRETGFLPIPELRQPERYADAVLIEWNAVEGAQFYEVNAQSWSLVDNVLTEDSSFQWKTGSTQLLVPVEAGFTYTFYVVAHNEETKRRSAASEPVAIEIQ